VECYDAVKFPALRSKHAKITGKSSPIASEERAIESGRAAKLVRCDSVEPARAIEYERFFRLRRRVESDSLSVVIPVYNEAENVPPLIERLQAALDGWSGEVEFLFVDDGSTDQTLELLKRAQLSEPRIRIAHFRRNLGQTAAMAAGFHLARGRAIVTVDGDLQNDPAEIPRLAGLLAEWDVVCGIRVRRQDTWWKRRSSRIANRFRNWATGDDIVDTGCTLKAYRRECVERLELYNGLHRFLPTLLKMRGYRVTQVPVAHHPRLAGKTKYDTWRRLKKGLADVWAVRWMKKNWISYERVLEVVETPASLNTHKGAATR
jgi:glycosyltransferase involved in cell wall biosynthesis